MKIAITGNQGDLCIRLIKHLEERFGKIEQLSLFGDEWKGKTFDYDVLVHIAGVIPKSGVTKEQYYAINAELSRAVAQKAKDDGTKHVVVFSTMAVYGMSPSLLKKGGVVSSNTALCPDTDYGKSKLEGEDAFRDLESDNFKITYLRIPSVYYEGNTLFMNVAKEMYAKFPRYYPRFGENLGRAAIYAGNVCECVALIIERQQYGIVCPQDAPSFSLYDYMNIMNEKNNNEKKASVILGMLVRLVMFVKPEWKLVFGQIRYSDELADVMDGDYRIFEQKTKLRECL